MKKIILLLLSALIITGMCGCKKKSEENYFGGKGEISQTGGSIFQDDTNIYFGWDTLKKFNKKTKTVSIACQTPGCTHSNSSCKAVMNMGVNSVNYRVFNGSLIKGVDERISNPDGTNSSQGYLYLCGEDRQVFENVFPDSFTDEQKNERPDRSVRVMNVLGEDYLAIDCSGFMHIIDTDFNIKFTVFDMGPWGGGVYLYDNEIYYINRFYRLMKIDKETGEVSGVDLNSMRITEGVLYDDTLWFSNGDKSICSYDFKTGETKEYAQKGVRFTLMGKYLEYAAWETEAHSVSDVHLLDLETCEDREWELVTDINVDVFCVDGNYYSYDDDGSLTQYSEDLSEIANVYTLTD